MAKGIDHLVLAARDLDAQAAFYRRLGFQVGAQNRHPWGTLNHIVQFDGCFLELIGVEHGFTPADVTMPVAQFANFIDGYLKRREGFAMLVLESGDAAADHARFERSGIAGLGPFFFERRGKRADGSDVHVAFSLAFAKPPAIRDAGFFVCQQHFPENFWNAAFQSHPNTVEGVAAVVIAAADPAGHAPFVSAYADSTDVRPLDHGVSVVTPRGSIEILTPVGVRAAFGHAALDSDDGVPRFAGVRFVCRDLEKVRSNLAGGNVAYDQHGDLIVVPPTAGFGAALAFEQRRAAT